MSETECNDVKGNRLITKEPIYYVRGGSLHKGEIVAMTRGSFSIRNLGTGKIESVVRSLSNNNHIIKI